MPFSCGGFCEITPDSLTILAERASNADAMSADATAAELKSAESDLAAAGDDDARWLANTAIERLKSLGSKAA